MKPFDFPLLADENVHPDVIQALREEGHDVATVHDEGLVGLSDLAILQRAHSQGRVVLTHDSDFGTLVLRSGKAYIGIIFLRPGHILATFTRESISAVQSTVGDIESPFIIVAERRGSNVRVRVRHGVPDE